MWRQTRFSPPSMGSRAPAALDLTVSLLNSTHWREHGVSSTAVTETAELKHAENGSVKVGSWPACIPMAVIEYGEWGERTKAHQEYTVQLQGDRSSFSSRRTAEHCSRAFARGLAGFRVRGDPIFETWSSYVVRFHFQVALQWFECCLGGNFSYICKPNWSWFSLYIFSAKQSIQ